MNSVAGRPGWTRIDLVVEQTGGRLPLHDLARLGLVKMEQELGAGNGRAMRWWWVEDASLTAFLGRCRAELRTRTIYYLPADIEAILSCQEQGNRLVSK